MKTLLIRDADVVVTMDDQRRELARASVLVRVQVRWYDLTYIIVATGPNMEFTGATGPNSTYFCPLPVSCACAREAGPWHT